QLIPIFLNGKQVYNSPSLEEIVAYSKEQINTLWEEVLRFEHPHQYYVDLSKNLWTLKTDLLEKYSK
ncbi:nicotinate phosphoribosyltransferase, partial [Turicibacter sanguinis]|nr:nicotinate phosphoribosyltransferase [Turicibacter sanguinis]